MTRLVDLLCGLLLWSQECGIARATWVFPGDGGVCEDWAQAGFFYRTFSLCMPGNLQEISVSLFWAAGLRCSPLSCWDTQGSFLPAVCYAGLPSAAQVRAASSWRPIGDGVGTIQSKNPASASYLESLAPSTQLRVLLLDHPSSPNPQTLNPMPGKE